MCCWPFYSSYHGMTYFMYQFCVLITSFKKSVAVPRVRHLVAGLFMAGA